MDTKGGSALKSKYDTNVAPHMANITKWAESGATAKDIAQKLGISYSTFRKYITLGQQGNALYTALSVAFTQACAKPDSAVENALYRKTQGYNAKIIKHYKLKSVEYDAETGKRLRESETLVAAEDEVHISADTSAQMFWLTNRMSDKWAYKPNQEQQDVEAGGVVLLPSVMEIPSPPTEMNVGDESG